jgi:putative FmdB family regulatory protein
MTACLHIAYFPVFPGGFQKMPVYEYECSQCGEIEEVIQKFSDEPLTTCRHCAGKLVKLISQSSFHLKGSGWYVTDYADKSKRKNKTAKKEDGGSTTADAKKPDKSPRDDAK